MSKRRHTWFHRIYCLLMAFYVINVSIDAPDGYVTPNTKGEYHEDLSVNEIESIGELILEHWFDLHDAVPEHDEPEEDEGTNQLTKLFFDWSVPAPSVCYQFFRTEGYVSVTYLPYVTSCYFFSPAKVNTPPPQLA